MDYCTFATRWGWVAVVMGPNGLAGLVLPQADKGSAVMFIQERWGHCEEKNPERLGDLPCRLAAYLSGDRMDFSGEALDWRGMTGFQRRALETVRTIPYGKVRSYRWVAERAGLAGSYRAVGQALKRNPVPLVIPCHRVISQSGNPGGFSAGVDLKLRLLRLEGAELKPQYHLGY